MANVRCTLLQRRHSTFICLKSFSCGVHTVWTRSALFTRTDWFGFYICTEELDRGKRCAGIAESGSLLFLSQAQLPCHLSNNQYDSRCSLAHFTEWFISPYLPPFHFIFTFWWNLRPGRKLKILSNIVVDPGGHWGRVLLLSLQILSFSCNFQKDICQIIGRHTHLRVWRSPGKSWIHHTNSLKKIQKRFRWTGTKYSWWQF